MKKLTVLLIGALVCFLWIAVALMLLLYRTTLRAVEPIQKANSELSTEVANFLNPTPTIVSDPITIINEVRSLARLETIQYSVEKVITGDSGQDILTPLFGDRLLFVAHGTVTGGVDLDKLTPADITIENGIVKIRLPEAEIFSASLDNERSYVFDRQTGVLTHGNPDLETQVRRLAEEEIYAAALEDGILIQARINAENYLARLLHDLGHDNVIFVNPTATPDAD